MASELGAHPGSVYRAVARRRARSERGCLVRVGPLLDLGREAGELFKAEHAALRDATTARLVEMTLYLQEGGQA